MKNDLNNHIRTITVMLSLCITGGLFYINPKVFSVTVFCVFCFLFIYCIIYAMVCSTETDEDE